MEKTLKLIDFVSKRGTKIARGLTWAVIALLIGQYFYQVSNNHWIDLVSKPIFFIITALIFGIAIGLAMMITEQNMKEEKASGQDWAVWIMCMAAVLLIGSGIGGYAAGSLLSPWSGQHNELNHAYSTAAYFELRGDKLIPYNSEWAPPWKTIKCLPPIGYGGLLKENFRFKTDSGKEYEMTVYLQAVYDFNRFGYKRFSSQFIFPERIEQKLEDKTRLALRNSLIIHEDELGNLYRPLNTRYLGNEPKAVSTIKKEIVDQISGEDFYPGLKVKAYFTTDEG